jgi:uncharacterized protein YecA (UPF0149 family)
MRIMSDLLNRNRTPAELTSILAAEEAARFVDVSRNDLCPCESGLKYKRCHGAPHRVGLPTDP